MKSFFAGLFAALAGAVTLAVLFFRKSTPVVVVANPKLQALDDRALVVQKEVDNLQKQVDNLKIEDKTLDDELKYWDKEKNDKLH